MDMDGSNLSIQLADFDADLDGPGLAQDWIGRKMGRDLRIPMPSWPFGVKNCEDVKILKGNEGDFNISTH